MDIELYASGVRNSLVDVFTKIDESTIGSNEGIKLPDFTSVVKDALMEKCSSDVWNELLNQTVNYSRWYFPDRVSILEDYRLIGNMIHRKYSSIGHFGTYPWSAFTHALSSKL